MPMNSNKQVAACRSLLKHLNENNMGVSLNPGLQIANN